MSYNSKYTGAQVEEFLDQIANGEIGGGGITTETDPIFSASPAASITDAKKAEWDGKQDAIADLDAIRSGAEKGATALQSVPSGYVTDAELSAVEAKIPNVTDALYPGSTDAIQSGVVLQTFADFSELFSQTLEQGLSGKVDKVNGKQLSTEDFTTILKTKLEGLNNYDDTELSNALSTLRGDFDKLVSGDTTTAIKTFNEVIAFLDGIQDSQDLSSIIASIEQQIAGKMDKVTLATVATSGSYNDLSDKPTIPSAVTESTVSGWGFTKNTGTYSKPSTGIPKTDLASAVQTSLGKADTALQSYTEQYKGTVTGVKINGTTKNPSSGIVDLGTVITSHQDISGKQDKLVSGTSIKTINGESILGSGNISISGGSGGGKEYVYAPLSVEPGGKIVEFTFIKPFEPNKVYVAKEAVSSISLGIMQRNHDLIGEEYTLMFQAATSDFRMTLPDKTFWANGIIPTIEANTYYEISIVSITFDRYSFNKAVLTPFKAVE